MKLREIAARLNEVAARAPACVHVTPVWLSATLGKYKVDRARATECACESDVFRFGTLVIRCRAGAEHIRAIADKYAKGPRALRAGSGLPARELPGRPTLRRPKDADAMLAALEAELAGDAPAFAEAA